MSLNAQEIAAVVKILNTDLNGAVVQKVLSEEARSRLVLVLRGQGETYSLRICLDAAFCRIGRIRELPPRSETPHPFVMLLRKSLVGRRVRAVETVGDDRVVRMVFYPESDNAALVCELTSRHANAFLINDEGAIAGSFFPNRSSLRKLVPGEPYVAPFPHPYSAGTTPGAESTGTNPAATCLDNDTVGGSLMPPQLTGTNRFVGSVSLEDDIEAFYREKETNAGLEELRISVLRKISSLRKKAEKLIDGLHTDLAKAKQGETFAAFGHVLKASLSNVKKGQAEYRGLDFEGVERVVPLDPALGPVENMDRLFDKAKRLTRAIAPIEARLESAVKRVADLSEKEEAARTGTADTLHALDIAVGRGSAASELLERYHRKEPQRRMPFREFTIYSGRPARVGRSAKENDDLTLKHAKPDDLWLHVRNATGSHVVVPMGRKEDPHPNLLIDAAHLAVHFSSLKGQTDVEVLYTRRRYVQKQKGSAPGAVRLLKEKSIALRVEEDRLRRILQKETPSH